MSAEQLKIVQERIKTSGYSMGQIISIIYNLPNFREIMGIKTEEESVKIR